MARAKVKLPGSGRRRLQMMAGLVLGALVLVLVLYNSSTTYLAPDEQGVVQVRYGPSKGIQEDIYGPGLHLILPGYAQMYRFPRDLQVLELNDDTIQHTPEAYTVPSMRIQTSDGATVIVDLNVLYRITNPYLVLLEVGAGRAFENQLVQPRAERILRRTLGELTAEQFYQGPARVERARQAREELNEELGPKGIEVAQVLVRKYTYDGAYQSTIEARAIQDQVRLRSQAETAAATQEAEKNRVVAEWQARVNVERQRGASEVRRIAAEADTYYRGQVARGDLAVELARARGTELENEAMRVVGAENQVGLRMADTLSGAEVIILPTDGEAGLNPLDLDAVLEAFDVQ